MSILGTISVIITLLLLCFAAKGRVFQWYVSRTVSAFFSCFYHFYFREGSIITGKLTQIFNCNWTKITFLSDAGMDRQVVKGRQALQELLEGRRTGKSEWSRSYDSIALLGLQLHDPSWCFHSIANQRTVDRVEIGMLADLSRSFLYI